MNNEEFRQFQERMEEAAKDFNSFVYDPEYPLRAYYHISYYLRSMFVSGYHPMNEKVMRQAVDAAMETCAYYAKECALPEVPMPREGQFAGPDDFRRIAQWFLTAHKLTAIEDHPTGPGQPGGTVGTKESSSAANTVNIQNSNVIMGDVHHPENLVLGDHASIRKETPTSQKNKKNIDRTITAFVVLLAALLTVLQIFFGWMGIIWRFLTGK